MRLTRRGVLVLAAAALLALTGWLFALPEASVLAVSAVVAVVVAWAWVLARRPNLEVRRVARPARCTVGDNCQIQLTSRNQSRRSSPVVLLSDDVGRHGIARLHLGPLAAEASAVAAYSLSADRRGLHRVGPLTVSVEDPFRLARSATTDDSRATVIVLPRTWPLTPLHAAHGDEPEQGARAVASLSTVDEEFSALREYVPGDDIRRIHWRSTARTWAPVVRQFDLPWQHRSTVVVDQRSHTGDRGAFERTVSVAASLVEQAAARGELLRLIISGSSSTADGFVSAPDHLDALMDRLAAVISVDQDTSSGQDPRGAPADDPDPRTPVSTGHPDRLVRVVEDVGATATGRLVVCSDGVGGAELLELLRVSERFGLRLVVTTSDSQRPPDQAVPSAMARAAHGTVVQFNWDGREPLDQVWQRATGAMSGRATRPAVDPVR